MKLNNLKQQIRNSESYEDILNNIKDNEITMGILNSHSFKEMKLDEQKKTILKQIDFLEKIF